MGIDAIAREIARIQADQLSLTLEGRLDFRSTDKAGELPWETDVLSQRLTSPDAAAKLLRVKWTAEIERFTDSTCGPGGCAPVPPNTSPACGTCANQIVFREPRTVLLTVTAGTQPPGTAEQQVLPTAQLKLPMAQWGAITTFPLKAGFGESRSLKLAMDEFGRRTSFTWASGARGEEITASAGGVAEAALGYRAQEQGEDLKAMKAEIDQIETEKKWKALKLCQAIIEAGGTCE